MKMEKAVMAVLMMLVLSITLTACDKGKKPYEEAETLFNKSDYAAAKSKAAEVMQNAPSSKYIAQAKAIYEKVEKIELLFKNAGEAVQGADYGKAIKEYEGVLALDPKSPKAMEELKAVRVKYKEGQFQAAGVLIENGEYEKGIDAYKELLALIPNDAESTEVLRKTEKTLADLKGVGNEAISEFRTYIKARGTMDYERAEFARVRYVDNAKEM
ncbi:MAG TPA: hypothetical protein VJL62_03635, partial [Thermodesulfobacteriota bacterium]|nr:hypothetical protein [Thermodesulfobacteriota bacterium]